MPEAVFTLAKVSTLTQVTMTHNSNTLVLALATLGSTTIKKKQSYLCCIAQGSQGTYSSDCRVSLLPTVLLTNFTNVNHPQE
jgi:hypothetical protein